LSSYSGGDRLCSFEATAARMHVIQSAISQHIKTLEPRAGQLQ
jgi:DNA-binding transcriptional LysR family regulator